MLYPKFLSMSDVFDDHVSSVCDIYPASGYIFRRAGQRIVEFCAVVKTKLHTTPFSSDVPPSMRVTKMHSQFPQLFCKYSMVLPGTVFLTNFTTFNESK